MSEVNSSIFLILNCFSDLFSLIFFEFSSIFIRILNLFLGTFVQFLLWHGFRILSVLCCPVSGFLPVIGSDWFCFGVGLVDCSYSFHVTLMLVFSAFVLLF